MSGIANDLLQSLQEAHEHAQGKIKLRSNTLFINDIKEYDANCVKALRGRLGYSQSGFARVIGVSKRTVEDWESGKNTPSGSARRLMEILEKAPDTFQRLGICV
jgi:putative transcriptional regulator